MILKKIKILFTKFVEYILQIKMNIMTYFKRLPLQIWKNYSKFRGESKFSTWMYRVALNTAISLFRKSKRKIKTQDFSTVSYKINM